MGPASGPPPRPSATGTPWDRPPSPDPQRALAKSRLLWRYPARRAKEFQILKREGAGDKRTLDDPMVFTAGFTAKLFRIKVRNARCS